MPQENIFDKKDLEGKTFEGWWKSVDPLFPEGVFSGTELAKRENLFNKQQPFSMYFVEYDSETGLFIAKAEDPMSPSAIAGRVYLSKALPVDESRQRRIEFSKCYGVVDSVPEYMRPTKTFWLYSGVITKADEQNPIITIVGNYFGKSFHDRPQGQFTLTEILG